MIVSMMDKCAVLVVVIMDRVEVGYVFVLILRILVLVLMMFVLNLMMFVLICRKGQSGLASAIYTF